MNNPLSGLVILVALFIQSPYAAAHGVLALSCSNFFAHAMSFEAVGFRVNFLRSQ